MSGRLTEKHEARVVILAQAFSHQPPSKQNAPDLSRMPDDVARLIALFAVGTHADAYRLVAQWGVTLAPLVYDKTPSLESWDGAGPVPWFLMEQHRRLLLVSSSSAAVCRLIQCTLGMLLLEKKEQGFHMDGILDLEHISHKDLMRLVRIVPPMLLHERHLQRLIAELPAPMRDRLARHRNSALSVAARAWLAPPLIFLAQLGFAVGAVCAGTRLISGPRFDMAVRAISMKGSPAYNSPSRTTMATVSAIVSHLLIMRGFLAIQRRPTKTPVDKRAKNILLVTAFASQALTIASSLFFLVRAHYCSKK